MVEVLISILYAETAWLKQAMRPAKHWIGLKLTGLRSNRSALGAKVRLTVGSHTQSDEVRSGGSYLSQNDLRLHFGIGTATRVDRIEIRWPSGQDQLLRAVSPDRVVLIEKPRRTPPRRHPPPRGVSPLNPL